MITNKNYGIQVSETQIEYAPSSLKIGGGIVVNPTESMYLKRGWYKVIDEKPEAESNCYVKLQRWTKDDSAKTLVAEYSQIMIPTVKEVRKYSKYKLEYAIFQLGKSKEFDDFIDETMLSNDFGQTVSLRKFYDQAQELATDSEYFETYLKEIETKLSIDNDTAQKILEQCEM